MGPAPEGLMSKDSERWVRIGYASATVMCRILSSHTVRDHNRIWIRIYPICDHRAYPIVWMLDDQPGKTLAKGLGTFRALSEGPGAF